MLNIVYYILAVALANLFISILLMIYNNNTTIDAYVGVKMS